MRLACMFLLGIGCADLSGLSDLRETSSSASVGSASASATSVTTGTGGADASSASSTAAAGTGGAGGGGSCGGVGEACCAGATCDDPTLACNGGTCGGCVEALVGAACVRRVDGQVFCWGYNGDLELGLGATQVLPAPVVHPDAAGATNLWRSTVNGAACFLVAGEVLCAGDDEDGLLGDGGTTGGQSAVLVSTGILDGASLGGAGNTACAVQTTGSVRCWGANYGGEMLDMMFVDRPAPILLPLGTDNVEVAGGGSHLCARKSNGDVVCWGDNTPPGVIGNGDTDTDNFYNTVAVDAPVGSAPFTRIVAGDPHVCALGQGGSVWCWGSGYEAENGQTTDASIPTRVPVIPAMKAIAAGQSHTCAVSQAGAVWCWGFNLDLQCGRPDTPGDPSDNIPSEVTLPRPALDVAAQGSNSCALLDDGSAYCWGKNLNGELGIGMVGASEAVPQRVKIPCTL